MIKIKNIKKLKRYIVKVYTYDSCFEFENNPPGRVIELEKEFDYYEEAVEFLRSGTDTKIIEITEEWR